MRARELTEVDWEDSHLKHAFRSETILLSTSRNLVKSAIKAFKDRQKRRELAKFKAEEMKKARKTEIRKKHVEKDNNNYNTNREGLVFTEQFERELKWNFIPKSDYIFN